MNPSVSSNLLPSGIEYVYFETGSSGSQLLGASITSGYGIQVNTSDIIIKRCKLTASIGLYYSISDINIIGNYFEGSSVSSAITISGYGAAANVKVNNNIFQKTVLGVSGSVVITFAECRNNVFDCPIVANNPSLRFNCAVFENNILKTPGASVMINDNTVSDPKVTYNFSASATGQFGTANNNQVVAMASLFVDQTSVTPDNKYKLKPGSAVGSDGSERGVFGGPAVTNRYVLSGLAPIPVIYNIVTSGVAGPAGLPVTIKARTIQ